MFFSLSLSVSFSLSLQILAEIFLILWRIQQINNTNIYKYLRKVTAILVRLL